MATASESIPSPAVPGSRFLALWQNPVGKKAVMAVTGLALFGFTLVHMAGNLKAFTGAEALDRYAELLRISPPILWTARAVLLTSLLLHIVAGVQLWLAKREARGMPYQDWRPTTSSVASRSMMVSGALLLLFVVGHLMDLTFGTPGVAAAGFEPGRVFANLVRSLGRGAVGVAYVTAVVALAFHLWHGLWSVTQSLGLAHRGVSAVIRRAAILLAVVLAVGFSAVPIAVLFGIVS